MAKCKDRKHPAQNNYRWTEQDMEDQLSFKTRLANIGVFPNSIDTMRYAVKICNKITDEDFSAIVQLIKSN